MLAEVRGKFPAVNFLIFNYNGYRVIVQWGFGDRSDRRSGKVKRIPPSASATAIFAGQYIRNFIPGGIFLFTDTLPEHRREME